MQKVQIIINGDDAADAVEQLKRLCAGLVASASPAAITAAAPAAEPAPPKPTKGKAKAEAAPATEGPTPAAASPAPADTSSASPAATGDASATTAAAIDLENGDEGGDGADVTYDALKNAMTAAMERTNDPLVVQQALFAATGAKALKQLTTTGVAGGPIQPGKGAPALAALEAVGRA